MNTFYLAVAAAYTLYFYWLVTTDAQAARHVQELADADKHSQRDMTVNDYFFSDDLEG